ncbi:hypothetical protein HAX54_016373 [Datura stramonium]|uniref:Uncharacterized protein n=1 Tax=Datura stramonium TaxID=4076 RepID=A0ABS8RZZ0_DATST|nr:hypothetical protein [Datura stramonium]
MNGALPVPGSSLSPGNMVLFYNIHDANRDCIIFLVVADEILEWCDEGEDNVCAMKSLCFVLLLILNSPSSLFSMNPLSPAMFVFAPIWRAKEPIIIHNEFVVNHTMEKGEDTLENTVEIDNDTTSTCPKQTTVVGQLSGQATPKHSPKLSCLVEFLELGSGLQKRLQRLPDQQSTLLG